MICKIILLCLIVRLSVGQEPYCSSFTFLEQLLEKLVRMETRLTTLETQFQEGLQSEGNRFSPVKVAFMATAATDRQLNLQNNQALGFDHVITNVGNGYDKSLGTFTAPVAGVYSFFTTVRTDNNAEIWGFIDVNKSPKAWFNARGTDGRHGSGSQSLIISLRIGDKVTVRNYGNGGNIFGRHHTSFSGYLLFAV